MPALRAAFAHTAAALAVLSAAVRRHPDSVQVGSNCYNVECRRQLVIVVAQPALLYLLSSSPSAHGPQGARQATPPALPCSDASQTQQQLPRTRLRVLAPSSSSQPCFPHCPLQAAGGLRTLTDAWGTVEAAMAAGLHDMLATMLAALPWDEDAHAVAYRHMPEVHNGSARLLRRRVG